MYNFYYVSKCIYVFNDNNDNNNNNKDNNKDNKSFIYLRLK